MTPAFRYVDGKLVECPNYGAAMRLATPNPMGLDRLLRPPPERARSVGTYGIDLAIEAKHSGVPAWFRPNASRRARCRAWSTMSREQHRAASPVSVFDVATFARLDGHMMRAQIGNAERPWETPATIEALLYLPEGERVTSQHGHDLWRAMGLQ